MVDPVSAAAVIAAGSSLVGTSMSALMDVGEWIVCGIEVENWTKFPLTNPQIHLECGEIRTPARDILPAKREAMIAKKTWRAHGSYGTVSWLVEGLNRRVVVMWSAPFDFNRHSNWLAVGITDHGAVSHHDSWTKDMYYKTSGTSLRFDLKEYWSHHAPASRTDDKINITGTMGSSHKTEVKITVRPTHNTDYALPIKCLLDQKLTMGTSCSQS